MWVEVEKELKTPPFYSSNTGVTGQRGTNENIYGRIRRTYLKGSDFSKMT